MSSQSPSIILGQRVKPGSEDLTTSELQQMVGKVLSILRYRRWLFLLPLLTGTMVVLGASLWIPRQYVLRTVFERRDDPVLLKLVSNSPFNFEMQRQALRFNVTGYSAVAEAVDQAGPDFSNVPEDQRAARKQDLVNQLAAGLQVGVINSTPNYDLIELKYVGEKPEIAEKVVSLLREKYIRQTMGSIRDVQRQAQEFFAKEVDQRRNQAARMQAELSQVLMEQPEVDPGRPDWLNERLLAENLTIEQLNRQKHELVTEIQSRREYLRQLDEAQAAGKLPSQSVFSTRTVDNPQRASLQTQIAQLTGEIADAKSVRHMKDTHPYVQSLNKKLTQLHIEFERVGQEIAGGLVQSEERDASPWDAERRRIAMDSKTYEGKLEQIERDLAAHQTTKSQLENQKSTVFERQQSHTLRQQALENVKTDLNVWQTKLEEINRVMAAENVDRGIRFVTVEECRNTGIPSSPKFSATMMLSLAVGLALAVTAVFIRELLDRSFRNPGRVRQVLGIPVLETIEEIIVRPSPRLWMNRYVLPATVALQAGVVTVMAWMLYLSLERPEAYARWVQTLSVRLSDMRVM